MTNSVTVACDNYYLARSEYERVKAEANRLKLIMDKRKNLLIDEMLATKLKNFKRDDDTSVNFRRAFSISVTKENSEDIRQWLVDTLGDDSEFVKEVINKPALAERLEDMVTKEVITLEAIPQFLHVSTRPEIVVRGWKQLAGFRGRR